MLQTSNALRFSYSVAFLFGVGFIAFSFRFVLRFSHAWQASNMKQNSNSVASNNPKPNHNVATTRHLLRRTQTNAPAPAHARVASLVPRAMRRAQGSHASNPLDETEPPW